MSQVEKWDKSLVKSKDKTLITAQGIGRVTPTSLTQVDSFVYKALLRDMVDLKSRGVAGLGGGTPGTRSSCCFGTTMGVNVRIV